MPRLEIEGAGAFDVEVDMKVRVSMTVSGTGARDPGHPPERRITPPPVWVERPY